MFEFKLDQICEENGQEGQPQGLLRHFKVQELPCGTVTEHAHDCVWDTCRAVGLVISMI